MHGKKCAQKKLTNNHTYYSLRYGTVEPKELLKMGQEKGYTCLALTDINNTSASLDFVRLAPKYSIRPVLGIDFRNGAQQMFVALAKNNKGFRELNDLLSEYSHQKIEFEIRAPQLKNCFVIYPFYAFQEKRIDPKELNENEFIGISIRELSRLKFSALKRHKDKLVLLQSATFRHKKDFNTHRLLRAIANNTLLSKLSKEEEGHPTDILHSYCDLQEILEEFPHIISNTEELLSKCSIDLDFSITKKSLNQRSYLASPKEDEELISKLCQEGLKYRYPNANKAVMDRLKKELTLIKQKGFVSYFLINWDIVSYARRKGYFYVGRGSGANSVVAYLLRITDVDPIELDLYFERFINLYRQNPPDFDIDFSWMDRDDVTRYIFERFPYVCLCGAYVTFQYKAVVRELGKVFGLPKHEIDVLSSGKFRMHEIDHMNQLVLKYSHLIQGFPNYVSVHSSGILISNEHIHNVTATFLPPKGYPTTHFDMVVAEDIGLEKFDILSQRGLGKIKDTLEIIDYNRPDDEVIDIHNMYRFKHDERIKHLLRNAKAIGCFYVESPAMRMLLRKLQVDDYLGLVAASSVIRPGVAKSGMMRTYIQRHRFPEKRKEIHPVMLDIMPETYGVMVYQEDVIKVAHYFAGLDLGEADVLRRGMSGKFRSREEFQKAKEAFFTKAREKGHPDDMVFEVWRQVESFAGYAFAKGHSASYAVESYQSLFLKAYYPIEYMVATINNFGGFYRTELYVQEARMHGAEIHAPCVNRSGAETILYGKKVFLGFGLLRELEHNVVKDILKERQNGLFKSLDDFVERISISVEQISILIRIGAFRFCEKTKKFLLWEAHFLLGHAPPKIATGILFRSDTQRYEIPALYSAPLEDAFTEIEIIGFPLCDPFLLLNEKPNTEVLAKDIPKHIGKEASIIGYLITVKKTKTARGDAMYFGTLLDRTGEWLDSVHFPPSAKQFPFRGRGIYEIKGKVVEEFDCYHVEASYMRKLPIVEDPRYADVKKANRQRMKDKQKKSVREFG